VTRHTSARGPNRGAWHHQRRIVYLRGETMDTFGYDRILVPTDMSDFAKLALRYAVMFQERLGTSLTLMFADEFYFPVDLLELPMGYYLENAPETKQKLGEQLRDYVKNNVPQGADALIVQDAPARAIVNTAKDMRADLIIMGTHGRHGWRRAVLGSVTESVLQDTDVPLLTVTPGLMNAEQTPQIRTILCPVNFTRIARESLIHACALAQAFDAELVVMHVAEKIDDEHVQPVETAFSQWVDPQVQKHCSYKRVIATGEDAAEIVLAAAQQMNIDLTVIGAQHKMFSEATVIGTTTERITRFARCPVMTVVRKAVLEEHIDQKKLIDVA
jgi:nucleotide-binding universal stress UspA family protein